MFNISISENKFFNNILEKEFDTIISKIKEGRWREKVEEIRLHLKNGENTKAIEKKNNLPAFTFSATFQNKRTEDNIKRYSGVIGLDYDKLDNPEQVKKLLIKSPYVYAAFISPSGNGVKIFVLTTNKEVSYHNNVFIEVKEYHDNLASIASDSSVKDIPRLCFVSYDPEAYLNNSAIPFKFKSEDISKPNLKKVWNQCEKQNGFYVGNRNNFMYYFACQANRHGYDCSETVSFASKFSTSDFPMSEIEKTVFSAFYKNVSERGKLLNTIIPIKEVEITHDNGVLLPKTANTWIKEAKLRPNPCKLFDSFWFENEVCILFADTNVGKSILAMQISNSISKGEKISGFEIGVESQKVIYCDFELSDKQFQIRYTDENNNTFNFDEKLIRVEIQSDSMFNDDIPFEENLINSLVKLISNTGAKILIIDNLTYLSAENEKAKDALPLMKKLKTIKNRFELSLLILAHTPKRDSSKEISKNDLAGSKMLINFCDSAFAIGESSHGNGLRYLKQIKVRNDTFKHDSHNIVTCKITKHENFLKFEKTGYDFERNHLRIISDKERSELIEKALDLHEKGCSNVEIAKEFNVSEGTIRNWIKKNSS